MKLNEPSITHAELLRILNYDPETGIFVWKIRPTQRRRVGDIAGYLTGRGYIRIRINGETIPAHRLAWFYFYRQWPKGCLDHRNLKKTDNRISNLREAGYNGNHCNTPRPKSNKSGCKGVSWNSDVRRWVASITCQGKWRYLGSFKNIEDAIAVRQAAALKLHGEFARLA